MVVAYRILVSAQVLVFCPGPGPGQDLTGPDLDLDWTGPDLDRDLSLTIRKEKKDHWLKRIVHDRKLPDKIQNI